MTSDSKAQSQGQADCGSSACYTPGPWFAHLNGKGAWCVKDGKDYDGSFVVAFRGTIEHRIGESEKNAKLIAAAPMLLAACEAAEELISDGITPWPYSTKDEREHVDNVKNMIRLAILEATGV